MPSLDLDRLRRRLPPAPLTRFAPSPTGYLHLGHAANAVFVWGIARALGGRVLLRLEDHDRGRCRPAFETALLEDLAWLGLEPDGGAAPDVREGPSFVRQSDCATVYEAALSRLAERSRVYGCACSRRSLAGAADAPAGVEIPYPGRCRDRGLPPAPGRGTRLVLAPGVERFDDALRGEQSQEPAAQCGDLLLRDRIDARLVAIREHFEAVCRGYGVSKEIDWKATADELEAFAQARLPADALVEVRRGEDEIRTRAGLKARLWPELAARVADR